MKHTPGPWSVERRSAEDVRIVDGNPNTTIATLGNWLPEFRAERDANARLISAAPDMFEALERTLSWLASYQANAAMADNGPYMQARAALKKARGE